MWDSSTAQEDEEEDNTCPLLPKLYLSQLST